MEMSPPSCALIPASRSAATSPGSTSVFSQSAELRLLETTYFFIGLMTSPNGWSAFAGQNAAHSSYSTRPISIASEPAKPAPTAAPISSSK